MTNHAVIALSPPTSRREIKAWKHERNKSIMMVQYMKKIGYTVHFLTPANLDVPFSTDDLNSGNLEDILKKISEENYIETEKNIVLFLSNNFRNPKIKDIKPFETLYNYLTGDINLAKPILRKILNIALKDIKDSEGIFDLSFIQASLINVDTEIIDINIGQIINFLEYMDQKIETVPGFNIILNMWNSSDYINRPKMKMKKKYLKNTNGHLGNGGDLIIHIQTERLKNLCKMISDIDTTNVSIEKVVEKLIAVYFDDLNDDEFGWVQLKPGLSKDNLFFLNNIENLLGALSGRRIILIGSGSRSSFIDNIEAPNNHIKIFSPPPKNRREIDRLNVAHGLVRANFIEVKPWQINYYQSSGRSFDIIGAYCFELQRLRKEGYIDIQYPKMVFDHAFIHELDLPPLPDYVIPSFDNGGYVVPDGLPPG